MINRLKNLLQAEPPADRETRFERVQVAICALLLEVAHSDGHYQTVEARVVHDLLANRFQLPPADVTELIDYAHRQRDESLDLFQFAREINTHFSREEKLQVMEGLWRVIYADGELDKYEDAFARQMAQLLRLSHKDVIDRKIKVMDEP
ncbi:MAG TPA: TerB family tellurite resistance protein [Desulfuromonadales bacterium]|nr:TerB family tellurite resistance protein [Desulfuromonadales bacterium]